MTINNIINERSYRNVSIARSLPRWIVFTIFFSTLFVSFFAQEVTGAQSKYNETDPLNFNAEYLNPQHSCDTLATLWKQKQIIYLNLYRA